MNDVKPGDWASRPARTALYTRAELEPLINPRTIGVIGASASGRGFGALALGNLLEADTGRPIYLVHPRFAQEPSPGGVIGVVSIADLPEPVDCLIVSVPGSDVLDVVAQAAERGCKSVLIFSAGFGEVEGGQQAEAELAAIAARTGILIGGPNTAGTLNFRQHLPLTFASDSRMEIPPGNLAIVSQSAGLGMHMAYRRMRGTGISYTIATGNSIDVTALDYASFLLEDSTTDVIVLILEGLSNPIGLLEIGRKSRQLGKPVLVLKTGRTRNGERAAVSHTGNLAGSYDVFVAAAEAAGLPLFQTIEDTIETAELFARWAKKEYRSGGVGVLTTFGGGGVMAADAADDCGVDLPHPSPAVVERLRTLMPAFGAMGNPIDTTASPKDEDLGEILQVLGSDPNFAAVVVLVASTGGPATEHRPAALAAAARKIAAPVAAVWWSSWQEGPGSEILDADPEIAIFRSSTRCMNAIAHWLNWHASRWDPIEIADSAPTLEENRRRALRATLRSAREQEPGKRTLSEAGSRDVLGALGFAMPRAEVVQTRDEAIDVARSFGAPVVAKIVSPDVPHKAAAGGVRLNVEGEEAVGAAFDDIMRAVTENCPDAELHGVLIAEQVQVSDEFMCGMVRDPVFGPVILCGAGGNAVEELNDIGRCVAPVTPAAAGRAIAKIWSLQRLRKKDPARAAAIEEQLAAAMLVLAAAADCEESIAEIDVNPIVPSADGSLLALDALVVLK